MNNRKNGNKRRYSLIPEGYEDEYKKYVQNETKKEYEHSMKDLKGKSEKMKNILEEFPIKTSSKRDQFVKSLSSNKNQKANHIKPTIRMENLIVEYLKQKGMKDTDGFKLIIQNGNYVVRYKNSEGNKVEENIPKEFIEYTKEQEDER